LKDSSRLTRDFQIHGALLVRDVDTEHLAAHADA